MGKKPKASRKRGGRTGRILARKEKYRNRRSKTININGKDILKPHWKDKEGNELSQSNKSNQLS